MQYDEFTPLFDTPLEIDDEGIKERSDGHVIVADERVRLLLRENRIALTKGRTAEISDPQDERVNLKHLYVPLRCVVHAHPECQFRWARLVLNFGTTRGALIRDMSPLEVRGNRPIEIKTSIGIGLKFAVANEALSAEVKPEFASSRTIYYPEIVSSGIGLKVGYWDFLARGNGYLHANRDLHLLVTAPRKESIRVGIRLRAKVGRIRSCGTFSTRRPPCDGHQ